EREAKSLGQPTAAFVVDAGAQLDAGQSQVGEAIAYQRLGGATHDTAPFVVTVDPVPNVGRRGVWVDAQPASADKESPLLQGDDGRHLPPAHEVFQARPNVRPRSLHRLRLLGPRLPARQPPLVALDELRYRLRMPLLRQHQADLIVDGDLE